MSRSRHQRHFEADLLGIVVLASFMFRAACPPERRFVKNPGSSAVTICASSPKSHSPTLFDLPRNDRSGVAINR